MNEENSADLSRGDHPAPRNGGKYPEALHIKATPKKATLKQALSQSSVEAVRTVDAVMTRMCRSGLHSEQSLTETSLGGWALLLGRHLAEADKRQVLQLE